MAKKKSAQRKTSKKVDRIAAAAAIRWYALRIELRALEVALSHPDAYARVKEILKMAKVSLDVIPTRDFAQAACPAPWERCSDNTCRPDCSEDERFPQGS
jgi:hypothetical protein